MAAEVKPLEVPGIPFSSIFDPPRLCSDEDAKKRPATIRAEVIRRKNEINQIAKKSLLDAVDTMVMLGQKLLNNIPGQMIPAGFIKCHRIAREYAKKPLLDAVDTMVMLGQKLLNNIRGQMIQAGFIKCHRKLYGLSGLSRAYSTLPYGYGFFTAVGIQLDHQANERIEAKPAGIGPYSLISNFEGKRRNPVFTLCNSVIYNSLLHPLLAGDVHPLLAGDVQGGGRNRNQRQITGRNADHTAINIRVAVPTGGPDAGGGGGPDAGGGGGPDAGGGGGPPGGGPDAGGGGGPDAGGAGGPDAGGGGNLAVCVFTASVGKAALIRYTATPGSSRSRSRSTKSEVLSYLIMTFDTVAFLTSFAAIYMRRKRPQVSTILENIAAFSLISGFLCMNMKDEFLA